MDIRIEKWYVKYAWIIFFIYGLLTVITAPINLLGAPPNPPSPVGMTGLTLDQIGVQIPGMLDYITSISVQLGNFLLGLGVLIMSIAAVPYRKGERWARYALWIFPVNLNIQLINSQGGFAWQLDVAFLVIVLAGLFMPYRRFFQKEGVAR